MKSFHVFQVLLWCTFFQYCTLNYARAQNSPTLNIQGVLRNSNGTAVENGVYKIKFSLYTVETGGTSVWSETQDSVVVNGGVYSTSLGKKTPMTAAFDQVYYLGVKVGSGQEMTPRALLSSAPYSLALIGQSNTFPSSGAIGVGTNTPDAGYLLHAKKSGGPADILLEGLEHSRLYFKTNRGLSRLALEGDNFVMSPPNSVATYFQYNGSTKLVVGDGGAWVDGNLSATNTLVSQNLGVAGYAAVGDNNPGNNSGWNFVVRGSTFFDGFVQLSGNGVRGWNPGPANYINETLNPLVQIFPGDRNLGFIMTANGWIRANQIFLSSDRRIKTDFSRSEAAEDLDVLRKLQVTNYRHIDTLEHGSKLKKGLIAQEVKKVMENAVTISSDFIPNIFTVSKGMQFTNGKLTVTMEKNHGLEVGDAVKLYSEKEEKVVVLAVPSTNSFVVEWKSPAPKAEKIFVYGKGVRDFHSVDYDQIFTLNVSATQELARQVELLKKENEALKLENGALKAADSKFESRLRMLESKLNN
jgi:hypothetical protein